MYNKKSKLVHETVSLRL
uniref:Uncharacterized protein n=1 Tax=Anguilla anguilla TaxID=7936 RepID=A0A0E9TQ78_ANGAN